MNNPVEYPYKAEHFDAKTLCETIAFACNTAYENGFIAALDKAISELDSREYTEDRLTSNAVLIAKGILGDIKESIAIKKNDN